jgi:hypothetical protein
MNDPGWLEEPPDTVRELRELLLAYLDFYRDTAIRKIDGLTETEVRSSRLPSGWTPLEAVQHLAYMERRWVQWGFAGEQLPDPWGDNSPGTERWSVDASTSTADVVEHLRRVGTRTRAIVGIAELTTVARIGGRFTGDREPPPLGWILLHVLQEYARHVGHLDVARELADGSVGE